MDEMNKFFVDDRGSFCDIKGDYPFDIKRVYVCENFTRGTIRGFHYHEKEEKLFYVPRGAVKFIIFPLTSEEAKQIDKNVRFLSQVKINPQIIILADKTHNTLHVPASYANAWMTLTDDTILIGCSNRTLEESVNDDIRIDPDKLMFKDLWEVKNR